VDSTGTTIIKDCWAAYGSLREEGYTHFTVNHSNAFVDERSGVHTNTMAGTWKHIKGLLNRYNRKANYVHFLAEYMFRQKCKAVEVDPFCKFVETVATIDWNNSDDAQ
jgi:hypothetical protein